MARLGDIVTVSASTQELDDDQIWLLNLDMVAQQTGDIISYNLVTKDDLNGSIIQFDTENVLYSKLRPNLNKVVVPNQPGFATSEMLPLRPDTAVLKREYLAAYLRSDNFVKWAVSKTAGAKMPRLGTKELLNKDIPIPTIERQGYITVVLDKIAALISLRKQQLAKLDELVKARFVEMFGDPVSNPMGWEEVLLETYLDIISGYAFKSDGFQEDGIPVLRIGNINSGHFLPLNMVFWPDDCTLNRYKVYPGDLVMSLTGTVGKDDYGNVCILSNEYFEYYLNQRNAKLVIKGTLNKYYLSELLRFGKVKSRLTGISRGVRQANISNKDILNLCVPIPPKELQDKFGQFIVKIETSRLTIQQSLDKLEVLKKSFMQEYFG